MIVGYQFDRAKVPAIADASIYSYMFYNNSFVISGRGNEMNVTTNALSCEIDAGQAIIQGRLVEILTPETVEIPANSSGFLVIQIDLSQVNESIGIPGTSEYRVTNNQVIATFVNQLLTDDLNNGGVSYSFSLGSVSSTSSTVTFTRNDQAWAQICPYRIGDILQTTNPDNPSTSWIGTSWEAWGQGRVIIGMGSNGTTNYTIIGAMGGEEKHVLTTAELPTMSWGFGHHGDEAGSLLRAWYGSSGITNGSININAYSPPNPQNAGGVSARDIRWTVGNNTAHENRMPYVTCYMWRRIA